MGTAAAVVALSLLGVLQWRGRRAPRLKMILAFIGGAGLTGGAIGQMVQSAVVSLSEAVGDATASAFGVAVPALLAIVAVVIAVIDVRHDKKADAPALIAAFALPVLLASQGGLLGDLGNGAADGVTDLAGRMLAALTGGG